MSDNLLPCPFCGGDAHYLRADDADNGYCVECSQCWASSRVHLSLMDDARPVVAAAWNRRVPVAAPMVPEIRICTGELCTWCGVVSETVHPKHSPDVLLCPRCHNSTEVLTVEGLPVAAPVPAEVREAIRTVWEVAHVRGHMSYIRKAIDTVSAWLAAQEEQ